MEARDLRYNSIGERVSGVIREGVKPALGGVGVTEPELDGALVAGIDRFDVLDVGNLVVWCYAGWCVRLTTPSRPRGGNR